MVWPALSAISGTPATSQGELHLDCPHGGVSILRRARDECKRVAVRNCNAIAGAAGFGRVETRLVLETSFERARLQPCRSGPHEHWALAPEEFNLPYAHHL